MCAALVEKVHEKGDDPDAIIGLLRGGVVPARIMADYFDIWENFHTIDVKLYDGVGVKRAKPYVGRFSYGDVANKKRIMLIDDIWDSGTSMKAVLNRFRLHNFSPDNLRIACLMVREGAEVNVDYYGDVAPEGEWVIFPWEAEEFKKEMENDK